MKKVWMVLLALAAVSASLNAQDLEDEVRRYAEANGKRYLQPLADVFGANLNSGLFHSAEIPKFGIHVKFGLAAMYAPISDDKKTFEPVYEPEWGIAEGLVLPTLFGDTDETVVEGITLPGGVWDTDFFPTAVPQLTIGSFMGTELTLRWIEYDIDDSIGKVKLSGWGLRHSVDQYIPLCPVNIAVGFYQQKFEVGRLVEATARYYGIQVSKSFSILTLYAGLAAEQSSLSIRYDFEDPNTTLTKVSFDMDGENTTRTTLGFSLDLFIGDLFVDMNMANQTTYSAGLALGF